MAIFALLVAGAGVSVLITAAVWTSKAAIKLTPSDIVEVNIIPELEQQVFQRPELKHITVAQPTNQDDKFCIGFTI